jgi:copper(I)-binding protein
MRMRAAGEVTIAAGNALTLAPGGLHIMLTDLSSDLVPGDAIDLRLHFKSGAVVPVHATVRTP